MVKVKKYLIFATCIVIPYLAGVIGSLFTQKTMYPWYESIQKPVINPPDYVFAPVWLILYFLMGVALYAFVTSPISLKLKNSGIKFFLMQLLANAFWPVVFFRFHLLGWSFVLILLLLVLIILNIINFYKGNKISSYLLIPYFLWVAFAAVLNGWIYFIN